MSDKIKEEELLIETTGKLKKIRYDKPTKAVIENSAVSKIKEENRNSVGSASDGSSSVADRLTALEEKFDKVTKIIESGFANLNTSVATVDVVNTLWNGSGGDESRNEGFGLNGISDSANDIQGTANCIYGDVKEIKNHTSVLENRFNSVNSSHNNLQTGINNIKSNVSVMRTEISSIDGNITDVKSKVEDVKASVEKIEKKVGNNVAYGGLRSSDVEREIKNNNSNIEKDIMHHRNLTLFTVIGGILTVLAGIFFIATWVFGEPADVDLFATSFIFILFSVCALVISNVAVYIGYFIDVKKHNNVYKGYFYNSDWWYFGYITVILLFSCVAFGLSCALIFNF